MYVEIKSTNTVNPRDYKGITYAEQQAALVIPGEDYPVPFNLNVAQDKPHPVGKYSLAAASFHTDKFKNLKMDRVRLGTPLKA